MLSLTPHRPVLAVILKTAAIFLFVTLGAMIKATAGEIPAGQAVFFRSFFAIPVILLWAQSQGAMRQALVVQNPRGHVLRGVLGTAAMALTFTGLGLLPLPEVTAIGFATPIFAVILAALFLGETIRLIRISAVAVGLVGVLIMLWPRLGGAGDMHNAATIGALCILLATIARAFVQIQIRQLVQTDNTAAITFYFSLTASVLALFSIPFGWVMPAPYLAVLLVGAGIIGGVAQILVTTSYRFAPVSMLAPIDYTSMLFSVLIGYVWFGDLPTVIMLIGASFVIAGNALIIWREHQLAKRQAP